MARASKPQAYTGTVLVDKTPGTVPADLTALETAVPAAGQPAGEAWESLYGTTPDWQLARVLGGIWVDADISGTTMTGATALLPGTAGGNPVPPAGNQDLVVHGDGTWRELVPDWTPITDYSTGAITAVGGQIWRRDTAGTSGASFDATEETAWTAMGSTDVGRGDVLPNSATTSFDLFVVENTLDPVGEPDGLWYRAFGNWIVADSLLESGVTTGDVLPDALTSNDKVFVMENTLDPVGEPDGLWFLVNGNWLQAAPA